MRYGLGNEVLRDITDVFAKSLKVERALLFGSRAKGNYKPGSDLDIAIEAGNFSYGDLIRLGADLDDLDLLYTIDLLYIPFIEDPALLDHIRRVGIPIYTRTPADAPAV